MNRIEKAFAKAREEKRAVFVGYLCAGDPDFDSSVEACRAVIESGVDVLEIGVPFSDPLADGLTNQLAAQRALESGSTSTNLLKLVRAIRDFSEVPLVFYTYYNLVFAKGSDTYVAEAKSAGLDGILTLDLPPEEADEHLEACAKYDLKTVFIVAPTTPESRLEIICKATTGFVYYVSREGLKRTNLCRTTLQATFLKSNNTLICQLWLALASPRLTTFAPFPKRPMGSSSASTIVNCIAENPTNKEAMVQSLRAKMAMLLEGNSLAKN